jgi:hypothetical protein
MKTATFLTFVTALLASSIVSAMPAEKAEKRVVDDCVNLPPKFPICLAKYQYRAHV